MRWLTLGHCSQKEVQMPAPDPGLERSQITQTQKRPYGAKLVFEVIDPEKLGNLENVSILLSSGAVAVLEPARSAPWEGGRKFQFTLDGFSTAAKAESEGARLARSMLLVAVSLNFGLRVVYRGQLPATVYERYRSGGLTVSGYGTTGWPARVVVDEIANAFDVGPLDPALTLSMELCCSSMLETNAQSRFIGAVSAFEPLAKPETLGSEVATFVDNTLALLQKASEIDSKVRN
jgi:hypothetical protein